jgi:uncharacterized protein
MDDLERIKKDVELFRKNIKEIESIKIHSKEEKIIEKKVIEERIIEMARSYCKDTSYYLGKQDNLTAFGCITYAHGLLDAVRILNGII